MKPLLHLAFVAVSATLACSARTEAGALARCGFDGASLSPIVRDLLPRLGMRVPSAGVPLEIAQYPATANGSDHRVLVTASWGGPSNGAILWFDCSGTILDGAAAGYVLDVDFRAGSARNLIQLRSITGTGSGWRQETVHLFAAQPDRLVRVWSGVVADNSYQAEQVGAYEKDGALIHIDADSLVYSTVQYPVSLAEDGTWKRDRGRAERSVAVYLWNHASGKYVVRVRNRSSGPATGAGTAMNIEAP